MDYVYYKNFLHEQECNSILDNNYVKNNFEKSETFYSDKGPIIDTQVRNSESVSCSAKELSCFSRLKNLFFHANKVSGWNFSIDNFEDCQIIKYTTGNYFNWHHDDGIINNNFGRKLSMIVSLNDSKFYSGGNLIIQTSSLPKDIKFEKISALQNVGTVLVFPSFYYHKVSEVLSGCRYSLVMWAKGPKWL